MMVLPNEKEVDSIACDLIRMARLGQFSEMQSMALMLKRLGLTDTIKFIRNCILESYMDSCYENIYRNIENNFR